MSLPFIEGLYSEFLRNASAVPEDWKNYFFSISNGVRGNGAAPAVEVPQPLVLQERVDQLVRNYRILGHRVADLNPLAAPAPLLPELEPETYGFTEADLTLRFSCPSVMCADPEGALPLKEIVNRLRDTYCRAIGVEFMHIDESEARLWLQNRMESTQNRISLSRDEQLRILTRLTDAVIFEKFIQKKFIGAKSFSLEGGESLIPLLDLAIEKAGGQGVREIVLAMAHRGRLNVLANIMGKSPRWIFREFADADPEMFSGRGDVKYHLGHSSDWTTAAGARVHLSLCFNPSHLEFVNPVALGRMRAKQDRAGDTKRDRGMALMIHGDASFAGEGIVQETLNLSGLEGYSTGGALHVIVNNQLGFTTPPAQIMSSSYCSDIAKMLQIPIFHVNGEDPEAVAQAVQLAMDFRAAFKKDVLIDMYCYRKLGHNEGDDPSFTQPLLYKTIKARKPVAEGYLERLLKLDGITRQDAEDIARRRETHLTQELSASVKEALDPSSGSLRGIWEGYAGGYDTDSPEADTGVVKPRLSDLLEVQTRLPEGFHIHPKLLGGLQRRHEMAQEKHPLDWAAAESLAFASLASEGIRLRMSGQDTERGTFSQRHAVLHDFENGSRHIPLQHVAQGQGPVEIHNSPLSEAGVLGFEYGYSLDCPEGLVIWEAQFGDFWNAAEVIVDQFIAGAEDKWRRLSGIVLMLPHGFEGAGPEHSSARLERFLTLAAEDNLQVTYPTTPAQYFHLLRRQVLRRWRKPLIIMTPKSLLRHPRVTSGLDDFSAGRFRRVIPDTRKDARETRRILFCSGKIYYDLEKAREEQPKPDVAIVRIEQLYPLRDELLSEVLSPYPPETAVVWVQEEPENMGAWRHLRARFGERLLGRPFTLISRPASASPATGSASSHKREQESLIADAFRL